MTMGTRGHFLSSEYIRTCRWSYFIPNAPFSVILYCSLGIIFVLGHLNVICRRKNVLRVDTHGFILKRSLMAPGVLAPGGLGCSPSHLASVQVIWIAVLGVTSSVAGDCGVAGVGGLVLLSWMSCSCGGWDRVTHCRGRARYNTYTWTVWGQRRKKQSIGCYMWGRNQIMSESEKGREFHNNHLQCYKIIEHMAKT